MSKAKGEIQKIAQKIYDEMLSEIPENVPREDRHTVAMAVSGIYMRKRDYKNGQVWMEYAKREVL